VHGCHGGKPVIYPRNDYPCRADQQGASDGIKEEMVPGRHDNKRRQNRIGGREQA
jgi:hypothetical protein